MCSLLASVKANASAGSTVAHFSACLLQDILNHILNDIEIVMGQVGAALAKKTTKKKKKKGGNSKTSKPALVIEIDHVFPALFFF